MNKKKKVEDLIVGDVINIGDVEHPEWVKITKIDANPEYNDAHLLVFYTLLGENNRPLGEFFSDDSVFVYDDDDEEKISESSRLLNNKTFQFNYEVKKDKVGDVESFKNDLERYIYTLINTKYYNLIKLNSIDIVDSPKTYEITIKISIIANDPYFAKLMKSQGQYIDNYIDDYIDSYFN